MGPLPHSHRSGLKPLLLDDKKVLLVLVLKVSKTANIVIYGDIAVISPFRSL